MTGNEGYKNPSLRLGVKFLDDQQLDTTFPAWKTLLNRIENQRQSFWGEQAFRQQRPKETTPPRYIPCYDNVYALLGGRGSGKSSVLYSLIEKLKLEYPEDIYIPLIVPEMISDDNCSILGWVLSSLDVILSKLEEDIEKSGREPFSCGSSYAAEGTFFRNCRFQKQNSLRSKYEELFQISLAENMKTSGYLVEDVAYYQMNQARQQYRLLQNLSEFWNELTRTWYEVYGDKHSWKSDDAQLPMIFLFFDDIDIAPQRSMELLTTTFQFFANPNIVILVTADEDSLREVIYLKMLERMISSRSSSLLVDALPVKRSLASHTDRETRGEDYRYQQIDQMGQEFFDKVIPPSNRYFLNQYDTLNKKKNYYYSSMSQSYLMPKEAESCSISVDDLFNHQMRLLHDTVQNYKIKTGLRSDLNQTQTKDLDQNADKRLFKEVFFLMLGRRNRNIANACVEIINLVRQLCSLIDSSIPSKALYEKSNQKKIRQLILHMLDTLVLAKSGVSGEQRVNKTIGGELAHFTAYTDQILIQEEEGSKAYLRIQYEAVLQLYEEYLKEIQDQSDFQLMTVVNSNADQEMMTELYNQIRSRQNKDLGWIKKNFRTLFIILFFAESIMRQTNPEGHNTQHGYYEFSQIMNRNVVVPEYFINYNEYDKQKKKDFAELFPADFTIDKVLDTFPSLIAHAEYYVDLDFYNQTKDRRRFLRDLLNWNGENCTEKKQDALVELLNRQIGKNSEWARTVLCCMQIEASGIYMLTSNIFDFPGMFGKIMNVLPFGYEMIELMKREDKNFLLSDNCADAAKSLMGKCRNLLAESDSDQKTVLEYLDCQYSMQQRQGSAQQSLLMQEKNMVWNQKSDAVIKEYIRILWKNNINQSSTEKTAESFEQEGIEFEYRFIRFFKDLLLDLQIVILKYGKMYLSKDEATEIHNQINELLVFNSYDLIRARSTLVNELSQLEVNQVKNYLNIGYLISYLIQYQYEIDQQSYQEYVISENIDPVNKLIASLKFSLSSADILPEIVMPEQLKKSMDPNDGFILCLAAVQHLYPYYLAAQAYVEIFNRSSSTDDAYQMVACQLREKLLNNENRKLKEILEQTKETIAQQYYNYFEQQIRERNANE